MSPPSREITNQVSPAKKFKEFYPSLFVESPDMSGKKLSRDSEKTSKIKIIKPIIY